MGNPDQKHPCPDCRQCQWCSEERCRLCLRSPSRCRKKLSMAEQIALFERINAACDQDSTFFSPLCTQQEAKCDGGHSEG